MRLPCLCVYVCACVCVCVRKGLGLPQLMKCFCMHYKYEWVHAHSFTLKHAAIAGDGLSRTIRLFSVADAPRQALGCSFQALTVARSFKLACLMQPLKVPALGQRLHLDPAAPGHVLLLKDPEPSAMMLGL